jgi:hypothetical protein
MTPNENGHLPAFALAQASVIAADQLLRSCGGGNDKIVSVLIFTSASKRAQRTLERN